jgi:Domain of unknown function (DUF4126)
MISGLPWGLALGSGVNTYVPLFMLALFARFSHVVHLSPRFQFLVSDQALVILGALAACEILAQKFPALDNVWDFVHTLLRPLAGAVAAGAAISTDNAFELAAAMLMGAALATAAHSAKSGVRLASTTKTLGAANTLLSFGEDAAVISGTLLSIFSPWVMLVIVIVFVVGFALFGPWLLRVFFFDLRVVASWFGWLWGKIRRAPAPRDLKESLLELSPQRLKTLAGHLESGEELLGVLEGWKRSKRGPRVCWLLVTGRRLLLVERRRVRKPPVVSIPFSDLSLARARNLALFAKVELLTRRNESFTLNLRKTHARIGEITVEDICARAGIAPVTRLRPESPAARPATLGESVKI